jgi:hypothetical protein
MIHSSRRDRKTKAIAEVLAMIADVHTELEPHRRRAARETDEWLWGSATEFYTAMCPVAGHYSPHFGATSLDLWPGARAQGGTTSRRREVPRKPGASLPL